jgi:hypothetical protein
MSNLGMHKNIKQIAINIAALTAGAAIGTTLLVFYAYTAFRDTDY